MFHLVVNSLKSIVELSMFIFTFVQSCVAARAFLASSSKIHKITFQFHNFAKHTISDVIILICILEIECTQTNLGTQLT